MPPEAWDAWPSRVVENTRRVLGILREHAVQATFYVLGWVADRFPHLVDEIFRAGHEIGSHGYWHRLVYSQTPAEFRSDLRQSLRVLEARTHERVGTYRAPSFSITQRSLWALEILAEQGIRIDSSIFPTRHDRYGIRNADTGIHRVKTVMGELWEFPLSVVSMGFGRIPVGGGGYFRLYPWAVTRAALRRINRLQRPFVFYIHPWEFDPEQPRVPVSSRTSRIRHYVNLHRTEPRFHRLLSSFRFGTVSDVVRQHSESLSLGQPSDRAPAALRADAPATTERVGAGNE